MNRDRVKIGVVGIGRLGRLHAMQLKQVAEAEFIGIYDINPQRAAEVGREFGIPAFSSFAELLEAVEAVSIVTPTTHHFEYARQALSTNRHVFLEKPMAETLEQADQIIALGNERGLKIQVGHIERFNPAIMALEPLPINPLFIEAHRLANFSPRGADVAVVLDLMIHDIDLILSFVKSPVKEVRASGVSIISPAEDIANCRLQFENGCVANVTASRISARKMRKMRFFQPNAYISVDFLEGFSEIYYIDRGNFKPGETSLAFSLGQIKEGAEKKEIRYTRLNKAEINPLRYELQLFCQAILEDNTPPVTAEEGRRALRIAQIILRNIDEHTQLVKNHWKLG
ncbi:MAG: Gfo/Idh/MocA family protein [Calditrichia bacterium]